MEIGFLTFLLIVLIQAALFSLIFGRYLVARGCKVYYGLVQMWKTKKGLGVLEKLAKKHPRFWRAYGNFGIILAFGFLGALYVFRKRPILQRLALAGISSLFILSPVITSLLLSNTSMLPELAPAGLAYLLGYGPSLGVNAVLSGVDVLHRLLAGQHVVARAGPVIPGVNIKGSPFQNIPWYGWLVFPILLIVHEMSHGILARLGKIRIKSAGVILAGLLPLGAFVEPDDKKLERAEPEKTLPLFAAGSTANYFTAFTVFVLLSLVVSPLFQVTGLNQQFENYLDYPLVVASSNSNIPSGVKIMAINGFKVRTISDIHNITSQLGPGANVTLLTDRGEIRTKLNQEARLGVYLTQEYTRLPVYLSLIYHFVNFLSLVVFFNYVVGLMNLLPIVPLDGGLMLREFLWKVFGLDKKMAFSLTVLVSVIFGIGLLLNLLPVLIQL